MFCNRSHVIEKALATMSTSSNSITDSRCAVEIALNTMRSCDVPKIARATARTKSMSKPFISFVLGLKYPSRTVFWSTPTTRLPRSRIRRM